MNTTLMCALLGLSLAMPSQAPDAKQEDAKQTESQSASDRFDALEAEAEMVYDEWLADLRGKMKEAEENGTEPPMRSPQPGWLPPRRPRPRTSGSQNDFAAPKQPLMQ